MTRICPENTLDSNSTGLAIAEEVCPGVLPNMDDDGFLPTWYEAEPNTYPSQFGGKLSTTARSPIKRNRQRSKGVTTGLAVQAGWNTDLTQNNLSRLEQGFFFADAREKAKLVPINGAAGDITGIASGDKTVTGTGFPYLRAGQLIALDTPLNAGVYTVVSASATTVVTSEALVDESTNLDNATFSVVGEHFAAGEVGITVSGEVPTLHYGGTAAVAATGELTFTDQPDAADTVTVGGVEYTFVAGAPAAAGDVQIGGTVAVTITNLAATINGNSILTDANPLVTAVAASTTLTVTAKLAGSSGNSIATTETGENATWGAAMLASGAGHSLLALGVVPGEWVFVGGDGAGFAFANNVGYARVGSVSATDIVFDRTTWDAEAEAAGTLTVDIFTGTLIQNENDPDLIIKRSYQAQRTLGKDADGTMSQYVTGMFASTYKLSVPLNDKLTVDLAYIAMGEEFNSGATGLKEGSLVAALDEDAINSTNDLYEMAMTVIDSADSNPVKLFGFLSAADLTIDNNLKVVNALGVLGGIGVNVGIFQVSGTATAYFTDVSANVAITNNADVDCHFVFAKKNAGMVWDIGLLSLATDGIAISPNNPITLPLTTDAAQNKNGSTLTKTTFDYLPTIAMPEAA